MFVPSDENFSLGIKFARTNLDFRAGFGENLRDDAAGNIAKTGTKQFAVAAKVSPGIRRR